MLGVDVSKAELHGTWRDPATRRIGWHGAVPNSPAGIERLLRLVPPGAVVVEPTGRYGEALVRAAQAAGREVLLATPRRARAFLWAEQPRAKTDRLDSAGLALYGLGGRLRPYTLPSPAVDRVNQLLAARRGLSQSLMSLRQQRASLPLAAEALTPAIAGLERELAALDDRIAAAAEAEELAEAVAALDAVPGIGPVTAAALAACLVTKRFTRTRPSPTSASTSASASPAAAGASSASPSTATPSCGACSTSPPWHRPAAPATAPSPSATPASGPRA
jgi:transposase